MVALHIWLAFVAASLIVLVIPGPTILTVTSYSIAHGRRVSALLIAAVALGDSTALSLSLWGVGALLATTGFWFEVLKWTGGTYLIYLGVRLLRVRPSASLQLDAVAPLPRRRLFMNTYVVTALNPKGMIFYVAFLPQFIDPTVDASVQLWLLGTTFVVLATANATLYTVFASSIRRLLSSTTAQRRFNALGGSLLVGAGVWALCA